MEAAAAAQMSDKIRVVVADDHELFLDALEAILATDDRIEVVGRARNGREAVDCARKLRPHVVLMDISMPILDGIDATRQLRSEIVDACILMLTGSNASADVDRARRAGAIGYVTKDRIAAELIDAIIDAANRC